MKTYCGHRRDDGAVVVTVSGYGIQGFRSLPWRLDLANHSPDGFEWGYGGSGPAQLALAILADALEAPEGKKPPTGFEDDDDVAGQLRLKAIRLHQDFKWKFIAGLARDRPWIIKEKDVLEFVDSQKEQDA
jgi:hypothetical protein